MSAPKDAPDRQLDELYSEPPSRFIEIRKRLANELRDAGREEAAAYVRSLRKPTVAASAINRAVHARRQLASDVIAAVRELRRAHARTLEKGVGDPRFLRDAAAQEREAVTAMAAAAADILEREGGSPSADVLRRIGETLDAVALDEAVMERFARGRLEREARAAGLSLPVAPSDSGADRVPAADSQRQREARARASEAERELGRARRALETKERAVERARAQRDRAEAALDEAEQQLREARTALKGAERKVATARQGRGSAGR